MDKLTQRTLDEHAARLQWATELITVAYGHVHQNWEMSRWVWIPEKSDNRLKPRLEGCGYNWDQLHKEMREFLKYEE